jgi:MYXO-CTERM domain-containing protein
MRTAAWATVSGMKLPLFLVVAASLGLAGTAAAADAGTDAGADAGTGTDAGKPTTTPTPNPKMVEDAGAEPAAAPSDDDGGCSATAARDTRTSALGLSLAALLALAFTRRRARR